MSLTVICLYIMFGMSFFMFLHYKFLKIFEYCTSKSYRISTSGKKRNIWSIPGPLNLPLVGTKWIFFWQYSISQIHDVYASKFCRRNISLKISQIHYFFFQNSISFMVLLRLKSLQADSQLFTCTIARISRRFYAIQANFRSDLLQRLCPCTVWADQIDMPASESQTSKYICCSFTLGILGLFSPQKNNFQFVAITLFPFM